MQQNPVTFKASTKEGLRHNNENNNNNNKLTIHHGEKMFGLFLLISLLMSQQTSLTKSIQSLLRDAQVYSLGS